MPETNLNLILSEVNPSKNLLQEQSSQFLADSGKDLL